MRLQKNSDVPWIGTVPETWQVVPAASAFSERRIKSLEADIHLTPSQKFGVLPQAEYMNLTGNKVVLNLTGSDSMRHVEPGDFVSHLRSFQGGLEYSEIQGKVSAAYTVLSPKRALNGKFFHYLFKSDLYIQALQTTTDQLRDGQSIRYAQFKLLPIPFPPLAEQRLIADYLDRETAQIDAFITKNEELIRKLSERKSAAIYAAITRGVNHTSLKPSQIDWLGSVPHHWDIRSLKSTVESVKNGVWGNDPKQDESDIRCIRVADFDREKQRVSDADPTYRSIKVRERIGRVLQKGDLLLEKSGGGEKSPVGFVILYDREEPAVTSNFVAKMRLVKGLEPRYWLHVHGAMYRLRLTSRSIKQSTGIQNLDQASYFAERVAVPPLHEQILIANHLDKISTDTEHAVKAAKRAIVLARERRAALISAAVTGKIDVRSAA